MDGKKRIWQSDLFNTFDIRRTSIGSFLNDVNTVFIVKTTERYNQT